MKFLPLIGKQLKDDEVIELLEDYDAIVTYDFDRLHENIPDKYVATSEQQGFELVFDANQVLETIFLYVQSRNDFHPIELADIEDIQIFASVADVEAHCSNAGIPCLKGRGTFRLAPNTTWARIDTSRASIHYEFVEKCLSLITVMSPTVSPS